MARQSQIIQPSQEDLLRALTAGQGGFDSSLAVKGAIAGEDLASTILKNKQSQEDRVRTLSDKIKGLKNERDYKKRASAANPNIANEIGFIPKESAESILKANLASQSDEAKLARAKLRQDEQNTAPDKIKQILQVGDRTIGVTYGGVMKDIPLGGRAEPVVKPNLPATESRALAELGQVSEKLRQAKAIFDKSVTRDPKTGRPTSDSPLVGIMDNILARTNEFTGNPDADTTTFRTLITNNINQQIKAITGAQLSEPEAQRIMKALPSMNLNTAAFDQRLQDALRITEDIIREKQQAFSSGYSNVPDVLGAPGNGTPPPAAGNPGQKSGFRVISVRPSGSK